MAKIRCLECGSDIPRDAWSCPHCGEPAQAAAGGQTAGAISTRGMLCVLLLFILFPVLLFLLHIFVPEL
ncbi:MAG: hypothetical protein GY723_17920 [bacterium]|nr:hypothetical protein [bacterium]MCP5068341.1 hypothetical protein [bacterium]